MIVSEDAKDLVPYTEFKKGLRESLSLNEGDKPKAIAETYVTFTRTLREQIVDDERKRANAEREEREAQTLADHLGRGKSTAGLDDETLTALSNALTNISAFMGSTEGKMPDELSRLYSTVNSQIIEKRQQNY